MWWHLPELHMVRPHSCQLITQSRNTQVWRVCGHWRVWTWLPWGRRIQQQRSNCVSTHSIINPTLLWCSVLYLRHWLRSNRTICLPLCSLLAGYLKLKTKKNSRNSKTSQYLCYFEFQRVVWTLCNWRFFESLQHDCGQTYCLTDLPLSSSFCRGVGPRLFINGKVMLSLNR